MNFVSVNQHVSIPESLLTFTFSRSSGPGGQNVNKLNTRVQVSLDIANCSVLTDTQKRKISRRLKARMDNSGILHVVCQEYRSQHANRNGAVRRLAALLGEALKPVKVRKKTKPPKSAVEKRLRLKKQHSLKKQQRSAKPPMQ